MDTDLFAHPWMRIMANIPVQLASPKDLLQTLQLKGIHAVRVRSVWTATEFTGYGIVQFSSDWTGFYEVLKFGAEFEADNQGKNGWKSPGDKYGLYGWTTIDNDFNGDVPVARYLNRCCDQKLFKKLSMRIVKKQKLMMEILNREKAVVAEGTHKIKKRKTNHEEGGPSNK